MKKVAKGIFIKSGIGSNDSRYEIADPRPLIPFTPKQTMLCKDMGRKLALSAKVQS